VKTIGLIVLSVAISAAGQVLLRAGARGVPLLTTAAARNWHTWTAFLNWQILAGLFAWGVAALLWLVVLNRAELAYAYMLNGLNYILVPLLGHWILDERLTGTRLIGMALILAGIVVTGLGR